MEGAKICELGNCGNDGRDEAMYVREQTKQYVTLGVDGWCEAGLELRAEIPLPVLHFEDGATKRWYRERSTHAP